MNAPHRFNTLDGMRGIAAIAVMFQHFINHQGVSPRLFSNAGLAVDLFFCLSGFVIAHSYQLRLQDGMTPRAFPLKRFVRLYPMFFIGLVLGTAALVARVATGQSNLTLYETTIAIALNAICVPYVGDFYVQIGTNKVDSAIFPTNDPAWSLFFEIAINIVFSIWASRSAKSSPLLILSLGALSLVIYVRLTYQGAPGWGAENFLGGFPRTIFGFFSGVYIFFVLNRIRQYLPIVNPLYIMFLLMVVLLVPPIRGWWWLLLWLGNTLLLVPVLVAIGAVSQSGSSMIQRLFDYFGWISYPVYCLHFPILSIFTLIAENAGLGLSGVLFCTLVTVVIAHLTAKFIDEPIRASLSDFFFPANVSFPAR